MGVRIIALGGNRVPTFQFDGTGTNEGVESKSRTVKSFNVSIHSNLKGYLNSFMNIRCKN